MFTPRSSSKDFNSFCIPEEVTNFCGLPSYIVSLKKGCFPRLKCSFCVQSMHHWHMHIDQNSDQIKNYCVTGCRIFKLCNANCIFYLSYEQLIVPITITLSTEFKHYLSFLTSQRNMQGTYNYPKRNMK